MRLLVEKQRRILIEAGLEPLGSVLDPPVSLEVAWREVTGYWENPTRVINSGEPVDVDHEWIDLAREWGVISSDGLFLMSLGKIELPWEMVRLSGEFHLAEVILFNPSLGDFITCARDFPVVCGVTLEEPQEWILLVDFRNGNESPKVAAPGISG